jgi:hypothetical protein
MLQIIGIFLLGWLAIETTRVVYQHHALFSELQISLVTPWLVWLFPLPLVLPMIHRVFLYLNYPIPLGAIFFLPGIIVARQTGRRFDQSGHPRAKPIITAMAHVVTFGIMGMMGICVFTVFLWMRHS